MPTELTNISSFEFEGAIWKLCLDSQGPGLALEIRDADHFQVSFAYIDWQKQALIWKDFRLEEPWWVSLADLQGGVLFFTPYRDQKTPNTQGIQAYQARTRQLIWQNLDVFLYTISRDFILAQKEATSLSQLQKLDLQSGRNLGIWEDKKLPPAKFLANQPLHYPIHYSAESKHFPTLQTYLTERFNLQNIKAVDYLEYENLILISYFYGNNSELCNKLLILDTHAQVLLHETLNNSLEAIGLDTFFIYQRLLLFIRNKNELVCYQL